MRSALLSQATVHQIAGHSSEWMEFRCVAADSLALTNQGVDVQSSLPPDAGRCSITGLHLLLV